MHSAGFSPISGLVSVGKRTEQICLASSIFEMVPGVFRRDFVD
jgi:hypothetical protein